MPEVREDSKSTPDPEPDMELELAPSPPPLAETLAARRAKRQAIMAKYNGIASAGMNASPSPAPSGGIASAVQPPPPSSTVSDQGSLPNSFSVAPGDPSKENGVSGKKYHWIEGRG
jgi:serine/threonine-protein kinase PRP4